MLVYNGTIGNLEDNGTVDTVGTVGAVDIATGEITDVMKKIEVDVITVTDKDAGRDFVPEQYRSPCTKGVRLAGAFILKLLGLKRTREEQLLDSSVKFRRLTGPALGLKLELASRPCWQLDVGRLYLRRGTCRNVYVERIIPVCSA